MSDPLTDILTGHATAMQAISDGSTAKMLELCSEQAAALKTTPPQLTDIDGSEPPAATPTEAAKP